ncbi:MAG: PEP-CTERM sorting domain-containing protein [Candidatus Accumulibacter sp.]|uniref:cohesin domain-containing protein n=1 Tax=Accumulibacter sp. TaxID=2053492 RepID=UPI001AC8F453|nr:PEP-CTERM sorting domain-containing protein [Accumulibacter sp.]MBN8519652.1 PEP-CTERM sorting domain-containing protein [Accumulibacter sp.]MBO3711954.1 PEP-CTERM sorting domain-containing protein [Accumulibacter sp.]
MKTTHLARALFGGVLAGLVFLSGAASAYTLSFSPSAQDIGLGGFATVAVRIADVAPEPPGSPGGLGDYDFEVVYDPAIITFDQATDAGALGLAVGLDAVLLAPGRLNLSAFSLEAPDDLLALQSDSMLLLTLAFKGMAPGTSALFFENITLGDVLGTPRTSTSSNGSITVLAAAVPEPGTLALLAGAGLMALGGRRLRRAVPADSARPECSPGPGWIGSLLRQ